MKTIAALVIAAGLVACSPESVNTSGPPDVRTDSAAPAETNTLTGTFTLYQDEDVVRTADHCSGTGGYDDILDGIDVVVRDDAGRIIATSELVYAPSGQLVSTRCQFTFTVPDVPASPFYSVEVGDRGELTYSAADLDEAGWAIEVQVGQ